MQIFGRKRSEKPDKPAAEPCAIAVESDNHDVKPDNHDEEKVCGPNLASNACGGTNPDLPPQAAFREDPETPASAESKAVKNNLDHRLKIRFTPEELAEVKQKAKEAGTDCSKYVRGLLSAAELIHTPQPDCEALRTMLNRPGRRLNDILARANTTGFIDIPELEETLPGLWAYCRAVEVYYGKENEDEKSAV